MTNYQIHCFLAVARHMNFSHAAEELYTTQPSISKQIAALEKELGVSLIDRSVRNSIVLSSDGEIFLSAFQSMDQIFNQAVGESRKAHIDRVEALKVGYLKTWNLINLFDEYRTILQNDYSNIDLQLELNTQEALQSRLRNGTLDVILCLQDSIMNTKGLRIQPLSDIPLWAYVSRKHPAVSNFNDLSGEPVYILPPNEMRRPDSLFLGDNVSAVDIQYIEKPNTESILSALDTGTGYSFFDDCCWIRSYPEYCRLNLNTGITIPICAISLYAVDNPVVHHFCNFLKKWEF